MGNNFRSHFFFKNIVAVSVVACKRPYSKDLVRMSSVPLLILLSTKIMT